MARIGVFVGSSPLGLPELEVCGEQKTPWGSASAQAWRYPCGDHELMIVPRHGLQHEFAPHEINYRANMWLMHELGVDAVIGTFTVGGVDPNLAVGQLVVADQLIDYTYGRAWTYDDKLRHIDFSEPYDNALARALAEVDDNVAFGGVYACTQGPRLETSAEVLRLARDGATLVGMTGMPETALARELEIPFAALCLVVNPAAGVSDATIDMDELMAVSASGGRRMLEVLQAYIDTLD